MIDEIAKDSGRKRATFNVPYPSLSSLISFNTKDDFEKIPEENNILSGRKIVFNYKRAYKNDCTFEKCQFFVEQESAHLICQITFKNCFFTSCFMGSVTYQRVRFENVCFTNCDFSNSIFDSCVFDNCTFKRCSAYHPEFINTEINPSKFLSGICYLQQNYELSLDENKNEFIYTKFSLSKQIYNSNNSVGSHYLSDIGLYELKKNEFRYLKSTLKQSFKNKEYKHSFLTVIFLLFKWLNIQITNGGTSLSKLLVVVFFLLVFFNFYFSCSSIEEANYNFELSNNCFLRFCQWFPKTMSIFFAYGYTAFKTNNGLYFAIINLCAFLGIIFYAMVISILIRKIYK